MMHGQSKQKGVVLTEEEIKQRADKGQQILDSLNYFFQVRKGLVNQPEDLLAFTELLSKLCPEIATIYNLRREVLLNKFDKLKTELQQTKSLDVYKQLVKLVQSEFMLITILLKQHPKSYTLWTHRQWMVQRSQEIDEVINSINQENQLKLIEAIKMEYELCSKMLDRDERNFHVWNYRNWLSTISAFGQEDQFTKKKIEQNFSNFSAYHFRSKFFLKNYNQSHQIIERIKTEKVLGLLPIPFERLLEETELIQQAIYIQPKEHGVYLYQRWLVGVAQPFGVVRINKITNNSIIIQFNKNIQNVNNESFSISNEGKDIQINNLKSQGSEVVLQFDEQEKEEFKIKIINQIYQNNQENTILSEDEYSSFMVPCEINCRLENNELIQDKIIEQDFIDAIKKVQNYLDENISFIKQVIEEEQNNRFPYIQILYLLQFKLRTQRLIEQNNEIVKEALDYCEKLTKIQNDYQAKFLYEFWKQL